jgi:hypothetical protein
MGWSTKFYDPIELPRGRRLLTLRDAGRYIAALPASEQGRGDWQLAARVLLLVAEKGGDPMLARIAMMRALDLPAPASAPRRKRAKAYRLIS